MSPYLDHLDLRGVRGPLGRLLPRPAPLGEGPVAEVRAIIADVRARGDVALRELTRRLDGADVADVRVPAARCEEALAALDPELREALDEARAAVEAYHQHRLATPSTYQRGGVRVHDVPVPVDRAGLYAPGGRARYPSTVLMTAVPARVAGVAEVALCVPPGADGEVAPVLLAAAALAGVDEVYRVGGAQAIAAMAYGTESIRAVDVVAGPASFAGPSEVVVVADATTPPHFAAIDLVVQAEHGPDGLAWLVTWSEEVASAVDAEVARLVEAAPRRAEIESTLSSGGHVVIVDSAEQAIEVANAIAPEHLELCLDDASSLLPLVRHAGAVFLGPYAPASVGDYLAGPSHVLPTHGSARYASALGVEDFVRRMHAIEVDRAGIVRLAPHVARLARAEGLTCHAASVEIRAAAAAEAGTEAVVTPPAAPALPA